MRPESISGLAIFVAAVEAGSFAAAGRRLGLSASAIGKAVGRLEARLGVRLLQRTTRSIALTGEGEGLFRRCTQILEDLRDAESAITHAQSAPQGRLKVSLPTVIARRVVIPALPAFVAAYPKIDLEIGLDDRRVDIVREGYDLALRTGDLADSTLVARKLAQHRFVLCSAPSYFRAHGVPLTPDDLGKHACLRFRYPSTGRLEDWAFAGSPTHRPSTNGLVFNDGEALVVAALAGLGIAHLPDYAASAAVAAGRLQVVLADFAADRGGLWLVWPPSRNSLPRVKLFAEFIKRTITA